MTTTSSKASHESSVDFWQRAPEPGETFTLTTRPAIIKVTGYDKTKEAWIVMTDLGEFSIHRDSEGAWVIV